MSLLSVQQTSCMTKGYDCCGLSLTAIVQRHTTSGAVVQGSSSLNTSSTQAGGVFLVNLQDRLRACQLLVAACIRVSAVPKLYMNVQACRYIYHSTTTFAMSLSNPPAPSYSTKLM